MTEVLNLTKQMVSMRLIDAAIEILFTFNEPVSVHVLASSADRILSDLCSKSNVSIFEDKIIVPERRSEYLAAKRSAYNFMKHADNDPYSNHDFKPKANDIIIFLCLLRYKKLWSHESDTMKIFFLYFIIEYTQFFSNEIQNVKKSFPLFSKGEAQRKLLWAEKETFLKNAALISVPIFNL